MVLSALSTVTVKVGPFLVAIIFRVSVVYVISNNILAPIFSSTAPLI